MYLRDENEMLINAVSELTLGLSIGFSVLCHRLDALGLMSVDEFRAYMGALRASPALQSALGPHPDGDRRLAIQVIEALIDSLNLREQSEKSAKPWRPTLMAIEGGRKS